MKKLLSVVSAVMFLSSMAAAVDINLKAGFDFANNAIYYYEETISGYTADGNITKTSDIGFQGNGEVLFPVWRFIKVGGGIAYIAPRQINKNDKGNDPLKISMIPIYATIQVNPISKISGVFIKMDIGFSVLDFSGAIGDASFPGSALYFGIGGGYEFPFGLILDLSYNIYSSTTESESVGNTKTKWAYSFGAAVLSVGYKFKL